MPQPLGFEGTGRENGSLSGEVTGSVVVILWTDAKESGLWSSITLSRKAAQSQQLEVKECPDECSQDSRDLRLWTARASRDFTTLKTSPHLQF